MISRPHKQVILEHSIFSIEIVVGQIFVDFIAQFMRILQMLKLMSIIIKFTPSF